MKERRSKTFVALSVLALVTGLRSPSSSDALNESDYVFQEFGGTDTQELVVASINNRGVVAGQVDGSAFADSQGVIQQFSARNPETGDPWRTNANAINNLDVLVGAAGTFEMVSHSGTYIASATIFKDRQTRFIDQTSTSSFEATGINDAGEIVGTKAYDGFVRSVDGGVRVVYPMSTREQNNGLRIDAINTRGDFVGSSTVNVGKSVADDANKNLYPVHAFIQYAGRRRKVDIGHLPGLRNSAATALSDDAIVVGYSGTMSSPTQAKILGFSKAWVWRSGVLRELPTLQVNDPAFAYGISDKNGVVGCSGDHAVLWKHNRVQDLNAMTRLPTGVVLKCAKAINRSGWIAGEATDDGQPRGFVLVPRGQYK